MKLTVQLKIEMTNSANHYDYYLYFHIVEYILLRYENDCHYLEYFENITKIHLSEILHVPSQPPYEKYSHLPETVLK